MNKKNKDIEVNVTEVKVPQGNTHVVAQKLSIGKTEIGLVFEDGKKFIVQREGKRIGSVNSMEEGFQQLISDYNLSN